MIVVLNKEDVGSKKEVLDWIENYDHLLVKLSTSSEGLLKARRLLFVHSKQINGS
jgi:hypothetical protein